jgi:hypothetical protein
MSLSKCSWHDYITDSPIKIVKDETFDCDLTEIPSLQSSDIDYRIIDSETDPLHPKNHHSSELTSLNKSNIKDKKSESINRKFDYVFFYLVY